MRDFSYVILKSTFFHICMVKAMPGKMRKKDRKLKRLSFLAKISKHVTSNYSENSIKWTPSGTFRSVRLREAVRLKEVCKKCGRFVNDLHSTVTMYCDSFMLLRKLSRVPVHYLSLPTLICLSMQKH